MSERQRDCPFQEPNGGAVVVEEVRTGPPLSLVGDKLRQALVYCHLACVSVNTFVPDDLPQPPAWQASRLSVKRDGLMEPIRSAFRRQLTAFLALYNMLALEHRPGLVDQLLSMGSYQFASWLERIAKAGSVTG